MYKQSRFAELKVSTELVYWTNPLVRSLINHSTGLQALNEVISAIGLIKVSHLKLFFAENNHNKF